MMKNIEDEKKKVVEGIIKHYDESRKYLISNYVYEVPVSETDGKYTQIGKAVLIDPIWFKSPGYVSDFSFEGNSVAVGERAFFVKKVLDEMSPKKIDDLTQDNLDDLINSIRDTDTYILSPLTFKFDMFLKEWGAVYNYSNKRMEYKSIPLFYAQDDEIKDNLLILNKNAFRWEYLEFVNYGRETKDRISVTINLDSDSAEYRLTTKTVIKLTIDQPESCLLINSKSIKELLSI